MNHLPHFLSALVFAAFAHPSHADDFAARCADRAAIERVYHTHRMGTKQPFEQAMPQALREQVVRQDQHKETVLKKEDLDPELQKVLRVKLQKPGAVSAVIETPGGFLVFNTKEKSAETLSVASISIPKRSYEEWLAREL